MAKDFYSDSIGEAKSTLQHDRAELESLAEQIPEEEVRVQIQEMVDSFTAIEDTIDQSAQNLGVVDTVNQTLQEAQETAGQAAQGAQDAAEELDQLARESYQAAVDRAFDVQKSGMRLSRRFFENWVETLEEPSGESEEEGDQPDATEAARRKAEELGVDLSQIEGTGSGGRILVRDVVAAVDRV